MTISQAAALCTYMEKMYWTCPREIAVVEDLWLAESGQAVYVTAEVNNTKAIEWAKITACSFCPVNIVEYPLEDTLGKYVKLIITPTSKIVALYKWQLTPEELERLQEYNEPVNESIGYERNIADEQARKLYGWWNGVCDNTRHYTQNKLNGRISRVRAIALKRCDCPLCREQIQEELGL